MVDWIINVHSYLSSCLFLALWCSIGYLESRLISPGFACATWAVALIAVSLALVQRTELGPFRWLLAVLVLSGGSALIFRYYRSHKQTHAASEQKN
jgi:hypothetical protein